MRSIKQALNKNPVTTMVVLIVALVGGVVVIGYPSNMDEFKEYTVSVGAFAAGFGVLGIARSLGGKG